MDSQKKNKYKNLSKLDKKTNKNLQKIKSQLLEKIDVKEC